MTTQFSWFDTLHALSTCLSCTAASSSTDSLHSYVHNTRVARQSSTSSGSGSRARSQTNTQFLTDGLRPLLQEDSTDDEYADTLSLHSNVGDVGRSEGTRTKVKSKRRGKKVRHDDGWFTVFGYNLFGKRTGAIQLPISDDEDEEEPNRRIMSRTRSGGTLDSDAAQLDDEAIAALSRVHIAGQDQAAHQEAEEENRERVKKAEKAERRRRRKERKQREALERALAAGLSLDSNGVGGFEGYQGSGDDVIVPGPGNPPHSASSRSTSTTLTGGATDDEELADFDGSAYSRGAVNVTGTGGNSSGSRTTTSTNTRSSGASGSRSRRSRTHETPDRFHDDVPSPTLEPSFAVHPPNSVNDQVKQNRAKTHRTNPTLPSSSSVAASDSGRTTSTRSATDSLPSPTGSTSLGPGLSLSLSSPHDQAQASQQPHLTRNDGKTNKSTRPFYDRELNRGFPSVGFGRGRGNSLVNGAFLARRGDE